MCLAIQRACPLLLLLFLSACGSPEAQREALILTEDSAKRCERILSAVLAYWDLGGKSAHEFVTGYYSSEGRLETEPQEIRLEQARQALSALADSSGEERDLLFELYAGVDKLCGLARAPEGYSQLTYGARRSALRDEIAGTRAKLEILLPVTDSDRTVVLAKFAAPVEEAAQQAKLELAASKLRAQRQREAVELAGRLQREAARKAVQERRAGLTGEDLAATGALQEHVANFCNASLGFARDLQANQFNHSEECAVLKSSVSILRGQIPVGPPEEIRLLAGRILDDYTAGATECLEGFPTQALAFFAQGQQDCAQLDTKLREYGFTSN